MTIKETAIGTLATRAMLVDLDIHAWDGNKRDLYLTEEVRKNHKTDGSYIKRLIPKTEMTEVQSALGEVRKAHKTLTLPWSDNGYRIISAEAYFDYDSKMRKFINRFDTSVDGFLNKYDALVKAQAAKETNGSFNPKDYPDVAQLRKKFRVVITYSPIPEGKDLRVTLSGDALAAVKASIDSDQQSRIETAVHDIAERIQETLGHMVERLQSYKPGTDDEKAENTFRDTVVENVRDLAELLPKLNIIGDPRIDQMAADMLTLAKTAKPYKLRSDAKLRETTAAAAEKILSKVSDFI